MAIYISENGFIALTLSAIETSIKYEATGILLGYEVKRKDVINYYVENIIPYQIAERTSESVSVLPVRRNRIRRVFPNYMKYKIIGEFHTHPEGNIYLSPGDKKFIRSSGYELEIVVAIKIGNKTRRAWDYNYKTKILSGSIDRYLIKIAGWRVENEKIVRQIITCPFAVGFDYLKPF
ncbi:MAG: hypothetical protein HY578_06735 [Nitrospinae bacterium]|nr:hypothetical protein [Nitrospinota bacterium]